MFSVMPCGPCPGVSPDRREFAELCSKCDRRAPGYAESERASFPDAHGWDVGPIEPAAYVAERNYAIGDVWYDSMCCHNYIRPLDEQIAAVQKQLDDLLRTREIRSKVDGT